MIDVQSTQLLNATPYRSTTERQVEMLAALQPKTLAIMHGSSFAGDGENAFRNLASAMKEVLGKQVASIVNNVKQLWHSSIGTKRDRRKTGLASELHPQIML